MGEVRVPVVVEHPQTGARSEELIAIADTGATLTVVPANTLHQLGIQPIGNASVVLADGRRASRRIGNAVISIDGDSTPCRVLFGEADDAVLLGLTVLEQLGLAVDPVQRRLIRTDYLYRLHWGPRRAPQAPRRSERLGEPVALLDTT